MGLYSNHQKGNEARHPGDIEMQLITKEHYEIIEAFERVFKKGRHFKNGRLDKEAKGLWSKGCIYQDAEVNILFLAFRHGVAYGKATAQE